MTQTIIKTWGAWGAVLIAVGVFIWKWVLPRVDVYLEERRAQRREERETARKRDEQFIGMIKENLEDEQANRLAERERFLAVVDGTLKRQTEVLEGLTNSVNESLKTRRLSK